MNDSIRIKRFLKKGIQARILSAKQLLQLKPEHLTGVTELKDIDPAEIADTLKEVQSRMRAKSVKSKTNDIEEDSVMELIEKKAGSYLDEVKKIYSTY